MSTVDESTLQSGPIAYMARNGVAANLLMVGILAAGLVSVTGIQQEAWPVIPFNTVEASVAYPGASPEEIEESIVHKIEEQVEALQDVHSVRSVAAPGMASVRVEFKSGTPMDRALDDIESAVGRIQSFPADAERPEIREMTNRQSVVRLVVYGDVPERALKEVAFHIEDELASQPGVSLVETSGVRDYEVSIEVPTRQLRALRLTLSEVAEAVRRSSLDLSAGRVETTDARVLVRSIGQRYDQHDFEGIVVRSGEDGTALRVGDIAEVRDAFADSALIVRHQGLPAAFVEVYRADDEHVGDVASAVADYVDTTLRRSLPNGVEVSVWNDESQIYEERRDLLLKNGAQGLALVFLALALFLEIRLAIWVSVGLAVSGVGALAAMLALDLSLNSISLFAFVLAIGIVVDDAIVVAEHVHHERRRGAPGVVAAVQGARRIKVPLTFAVLTSVAAFAPLIFLPGGIGEIMTAVPVVLIAMLLISLVESLFILPNHLSHLPGPAWTPSNVVDRYLARIQASVDQALTRFVQGPLHRAVAFATDQPAVVIASVVGMLIVAVSLLPAGIVGTAFAEQVEGDFVTANLEMPTRTPAERTREVAREIETAGLRAIERLMREAPEDAPALLTGVTVTVGKGPRVEGGGLIAEPSLNPQANIATIEFKLLGAEQRWISTGAVLQAWREEVGILPYVRGLSFSGAVIALGNPVEAVLSHPDPDRVGLIADEVMSSLRSLGGVFDIRSDHTPGVQEVQIRLRPEGRALGLTFEDMARQVRGAFFGHEAVRLQRGGEDVRVHVRLPQEERDSITDIENYRVRTPGGGHVPLSQVAWLTLDASPPSIRRKDGQQVVTVTADVDTATISGAEANAFLADTVIPELTARHPGLAVRFGGEAEQQYESFDALNRGFALAILVIYAMLAIPLRSYTRPLLVMAVIPFGLIGAILGHLILGIPFSSTSAFGFVGLAGVVVNDSLVMLDFIAQRSRDGAPIKSAIVEGAKARFRPIMLTSVTTFLAFTPLILERAIHAKFLVPFAASLGFGLLFTTAILMVLVPALASVFLRTDRRTEESDAPDPAVPVQPAA